MRIESLREAYGQALVKAGSLNKDIVVLEADLGSPPVRAFFRRHIQRGILRWV